MISLKTIIPNPFIGNSLSLLKNHPPCGASCFVTLYIGLVNKSNRKTNGTHRNNMYRSQTFSGGITGREIGSTTQSPLIAYY